MIKVHSWSITVAEAKTTFIREAVKADRQSCRPHALQSFACQKLDSVGLE